MSATNLAGQVTPAATELGLHDLAKAINDLDALVELVGRSLSGTKPWKRELTAKLTQMDRLLQIPRLTIAMERPDTEIAEAARALRGACHRPPAAVTGSLADLTTQTAVRLAFDLSHKVWSALERTCP